MKNIFLYGPIIASDLKNKVDRIAKSEKGVLRGYSCHAVKGTEYKGIVLREGSEIQGMVYYDISDSLWEQLKRYFGENYATDTVVVEGEQGEIIETLVFVVRPRHAVMLDLSKEYICEIIDNPII